MRILHKVLLCESLFDAAYFLIVFIVMMSGMISFLGITLWYSVRLYDDIKLEVEKMQKVLDLL